MFNNISFILHKPQLSENIGACARAMKNFNFSKLIVINPKPSFPNDKIVATSVGAQEIIKKSKVYETLEPAIKNIDFLISTTSRFRNKNIKHIKLNELNKIDFKQDDPKIKKLLEEVKDREFIGYSYDGADASFELLARRIMGEIPRYI